MTAVLPEGLINATIAAGHHELGESDSRITNSQVLHQLWKVYDIQSNVTSDHASPRARNLFWRVWSCPRLSHSMTSDHLASLWRRCSQDFDATPIDPIETHPNWPRGSLPHNTVSHRQVRTRSSSVSPTHEVRQTLDSNLGATRDAGPSWRDGRVPTISSEPQRVQHPVSVERREDPGVQQLAQAPDPHSPPTPGSSSRASLSRTTSAGRIRQTLQATAGRSRSRPHIARRKSSSAKSSTGPVAERSLRDDPERAGGGSENVDPAVRHRLSGRGPPPGLPTVPAATRAPVFAPPSASSWQSVESTAENFMTMATAAPSSTSSGLVERDFRGKFVETQKKLTSSTNLAALGRMKKTGSVVRFADEIPQDWRKGKEKATVPDDNVGPSRLRSSFASSALTDEDNSSDDDDVALTRTKSQLSLLIKQKRNETGSQDLGPDARPQDRGTKDPDKGKGKENPKSKEEELLSMGQKDGVTKAGGVQLPKPQRLSEHDDPGHISSSSPEPLF